MLPNFIKKCLFLDYTRLYMYIFNDIVYYQYQHANLQYLRLTTINGANFCDFKFHFTAILTTFLATGVNRVA